MTGSGRPTRRGTPFDSPTDVGRLETLLPQTPQHQAAAAAAAAAADLVAVLTFGVALLLVDVATAAGAVVPGTLGTNTRKL